MAKQQRRFFVVFATASLWYLSTALVPANAADGPNQLTPSDLAAGRWVDSLLGSDTAPVSRAKKNQAWNRRTTSPGRRPQRTSGLRGKLVNNPNTQDGSPAFALVDRYGGVLRYIEPVESVDLEPYLGKAVAVRRDTGDILLASQLALPRKNSQTRRSSSANGLQLAQNLEPIPAGEPVPADETPSEPQPTADGHDHHHDPIHHDDEGIVYEGPVYLDEGEAYGDGLNFGGCPDCGDVTCQRRSGGCGFGARGVFYAHAEYLHWETKGMEIPPLVIQFQDFTLPSGPVVGPITTIFGGHEIFEDNRNGGRITLGLWLDDYGQWAIEGDYLALEDESLTRVFGVKDGLVPAVGNFIGRPFFNTGIIGGDVDSRGPSQEDVDTNRLDGTVTVRANTRFQTGGIRLRHNLCCREGCSTCCGDAVSCGSGVGCGSGILCEFGPFNRLYRLLRKGTRRTDILLGYRYASLEDDLSVMEDLSEFTSISTNPPTLGNELDVTDIFETRNEFHGGEIGYETEWSHNRWSLSLLTKIAIGSTNQRVRINGSTVIDDGLGLVETSRGGLLTQGFDHPGVDGIAGNADDFYVGNIGEYERDEFSVLPELGMTLGYNMTRRLKLTAGYTLLYWSNVVRAGEQVDLDVNGNLLNRNGVLLIQPPLFLAITLVLFFVRPIIGHMV